MVADKPGPVVNLCYSTEAAPEATYFLFQNIFFYLRPLYCGFRLAITNATEELFAFWRKNEGSHQDAQDQ